MNDYLASWCAMFAWAEYKHPDFGDMIYTKREQSEQ